MDPLASSPKFQKTQQNRNSPLPKASALYANWPSVVIVDRMKVPDTPHTAPEHNSAKTVTVVPSATTPHYSPMAVTAPILPSAKTPLVGTTPIVPKTATTPQVISTPHTARDHIVNTAISPLPPTASPYLTVATTQSSIVKSTPILGEATSQNVTESIKAIDFDEDLRLSKDHMDIIKNDFALQRKAEGKAISRDDVNAFTYVEEHCQHMQTSLQKCGRHLDMMIGKRYIYVTDALQTLEQVVSMGLITEKEVVLSHDVEKLHAASSSDVITVHSLSNIVRKILLGRSGTQKC